MNVHDFYQTLSINETQKIYFVFKNWKIFQEEIRSLNSHNSELRSQLEVLSSRTRDSSGTPDPRGDDSADTTPPPLGMCGMLL